MRVVYERLLPAVLGAALWFITDHLAFMAGGFILSLMLQVIGRPVLAEVYAQLLVYHEARQVQRRDHLLQTFLGFFNAYRAVLTKYPPELVPRYAPAITPHIETLLHSLRELKGRRLQRQASRYETVHGAPLTPRDFHFWTVHECRTWMENLLEALSEGQMAPLCRAVHAFAQDNDGRAWSAYLTAAEHDLDHAATQAMLRWHCVQRARKEPEVRERFLALLRLDDFHRQTGMQSFLRSPQLQCPPHEMDEIMADIRYVSVASQLLTVMDAPDTAKTEA